MSSRFFSHGLCFAIGLCGLLIVSSVQSHAAIYSSDAAQELQLEEPLAPIPLFPVSLPAPLHPEDENNSKLVVETGAVRSLVADHALLLAGYSSSDLSPPRQLCL